MASVRPNTENDPDDPFHALVPRYDLVLTYGGGDPVVRGYEAERE